VFLGALAVPTAKKTETTNLATLTALCGTALETLTDPRITETDDPSF
jgi:hypothetical protein